MTRQTIKKLFFPCQEDGWKQFLDIAPLQVITRNLSYQIYITSSRFKNKENENEMLSSIVIVYLFLTIANA